MEHEHLSTEELFQGEHFPLHVMHSLFGCTHMHLCGMCARVWMSVCACLDVCVCNHRVMKVGFKVLALVKTRNGLSVVLGYVI